MVLNKCGICKSRSKLTIHHILPRSEGGQNNKENLIVLCRPCHDFVEEQNVRSREAVLCCERPGMIVSELIGAFPIRRRVSKLKKARPIKEIKDCKKSHISKREWQNLHPVDNKKIRPVIRTDRMQMQKDKVVAKMAKRSCLYCGIDFEVKRDFQKFCSPKCRVKNWHLASGGQAKISGLEKIVADHESRLSILESQVKGLMEGQ